MANNIIDPSIYNITDMVHDVSKTYIPNKTEDTLSVGIFGYLIDMMSQQIQNDIIINSELGNELWPSRAKYEKNVIAHAIIQNINDINASPAILPIYLGLDQDEIFDLFIADVFTITKEMIFNIGDFEFHLEYDLMLIRTVIANNEYAYSAQYKIDRKNELSKITNPYTATPYVQIDQRRNMIYIPCQLMQVTHKIETKKVISSSSIDNKTFEFTFFDQLAGFEVCVNENGKETYLTPMFEGMGIENNIKDYCYYTYIDEQTIRVRFDSISYLPKLNDEITVYIYTTKGSEGNFDYDDIVYAKLTSDRFKYKNVYSIIRPAKRSTGGEDRKTVEELKRLLPKEALARGSITNMQDLKNYFNMMILDAEKTRIEIMKKVDNQFERSYFAYLVLKDVYDNVVPTNTIDIEIRRSQFTTRDNRKYVLKPSSYIVLENGIGHIYDKNDEKLIEMLKDDTHNYIYTIPFSLVVTDDPLYVSYYLSIMDYPAQLTFSYINHQATRQFIATYVEWCRKYLSEPNIYKLSIMLSPNISMLGDAAGDSSTNIGNKIRTILVLYNEDSTEPYRYCEGEFIDINMKTGRYIFNFNLETTDKLNDDNKIHIKNVSIPGTLATDYGYFTSHVEARIYVLYQFEASTEVYNEYGRYDLDSIVPVDGEGGTYGWSVTNMYTINGGLEFFYNYSQIMSSHVTDNVMETEYDEEYGFEVRSVPVIKHSYLNTEDNVQALVQQFNYEKAYIDKAIYLLENNFLIDFKLFNTYGSSTIFTIDKNGEIPVDRIHLTMNFEVRLLKTSDNQTKNYILHDIKQYVENLNDMSSLHIPNLITQITNDYRNSIEYFEFLGFNEYGPGYQHLYKQDKDDVTITPEFLCINVSDMTPDINLRVL